MKRFFTIVIVMLIGAGIYFRLSIYPKLPILNGYAAKNLCSCIFLANMSEKQVLDEDLSFPPTDLASSQVDYENKTVTSDFYGLYPKTAVYREGLGCALVNQKEVSEVRQQDFDLLDEEIADSVLHYFAAFDSIDLLTASQKRQMDMALDKAFQEENPEVNTKNTRAVVAIYKGKVVAERYAHNFTKHTKFPGWSMTKSLTAVLMANMARDSLLGLHDEIPVEAWKNDDRHYIQYRDALNMVTGLQWEEEYDRVCAVTEMLYKQDDMAEVVFAQPLVQPTRSKFYYSTGTTALLCKAIAQYFPTHYDYLLAPYQLFHQKMGMSSLLIETDASNHFVGSSYGWASTRDWGKFGWLMANDGVWNDERLISEEWMRFITAAAPDSDGEYGGHFWLNKGKVYPDLPTNTITCRGYHGQRIFIFPTEKLVVVRMGLTHDKTAFDSNAFAKSFYDIIN